VEAALNDFIDLILKDFVINMWYSDITPDMEFPEMIRDLIMDAIAEVSVRVKEINLVDLLTRYIIYLSFIICSQKKGIWEVLEINKITGCIMCHL